MDKTLLILLLLSIALIGAGAPYTTLTLLAIIALAVLSTWGSWSFLQGFGQRQPKVQPQRIWD